MPNIPELESEIKELMINLEKEKATGEKLVIQLGKKERIRETKKQ